MFRILLLIAALVTSAVTYAAISAQDKYLLNNKMGSVAAKVKLGDLVSDAGDTVADGAVTKAKLHSGVLPSHVVKFAGKHTTTANATNAVTVTGVASTDIVIANLQTPGGTPRTLLTAAPTTNTVTFIFSGDPGTDHVVSYVVYRAVP